MRHTAKRGPVWPLVLLVVLQAGCLAETDLDEVAGECGPRDLTPECCLKQNPGQWERCTGSSELAAEVAPRAPSLATKLTAAGTAVALNKLIREDRYWLHTRFMHNDAEGRWEHLNENEVSQIVTMEGWKGLTGTIEPDIILMDEKGFIMHVYDLKFPCPESNGTFWEWYKDGTWKDWSQGDLYQDALKVTPRLVSPRLGVVKE